MSGEAPGVGLADAIATVRAELEEAITAGKSSPLAFRAGPVEMEFQVSFSRTGTGQAGIKAWVVTAGARGGYGRSPPGWRPMPGAAARSRGHRAPASPTAARGGLQQQPPCVGGPPFYV